METQTEETKPSKPPCKCRLAACQGQCECPGLSYDRPCLGCTKTPPEAWRPDLCDVIQEMRRSTKLRETQAGRDEMRHEYRKAAGERARQSDDKVQWGECFEPVRRLGVPLKTLQAARKPTMDGAVAAAHHWWNVQRGGTPALALCGPTGIGKSVGAAYLLMQWALIKPWWRGKPSGHLRPEAMWVDVASLQALSLLRDDDEAMLDDAQRCAFLVLDEVDGVTAGAGAARFIRLLSKRLDDGALTVLTSNLTREVLQGAALGAHLGNRLKALAMMPTFSNHNSRRGTAKGPNK